MDIRKIIVAFVVVATSGCASVHSGNYAKNLLESKAETKDLLISAQLSLKLSSDYFGFVTLTFENLSDDWLELSDVKVDFNDEAHRKNITPIRGQKLAQWQRSITLRNKVYDHNESVALGSLLALGTLATFSNNNSTSKAGVTTAIASAGVLTAREINRDLEAINNNQSVPDSHLMYGAVLVPPLLSTKKWIVFNSKNHRDMEYKNSFTLTFRDQNNKKYKFNVKYNSRNSTFGTFKWL